MNHRNPNEFFAQHYLFESDVHAAIYDEERGIVALVINYLDYENWYIRFIQNKSDSGSQKDVITRWLFLIFTEVTAFRWYDWLYPEGYNGFNSARFSFSRTPSVAVKFETVSVEMDGNRHHIKMDLRSYGICSFSFHLLGVQEKMTTQLFEHCDPDELATDSYNREIVAFLELFDLHNR